MQQEFESRITSHNQPATLIEHGFVKILYRRCRNNQKKIDDCKVLATKQKQGGKLTDTQQTKLNNLSSIEAEVKADLLTLNNFLEHHVEPVVAPKEELKEAVEEMITEKVVVEQPAQEVADQVVEEVSTPVEQEEQPAPDVAE